MSYLTNFYRQRKENLIYIMGGKCQLCGYDKSPAAFDFHHIHPEEKKFTFSNTNCYQNKEKITEELQKCALLCANCHRELHYGNAELPELISSYSQERADEIFSQVQKPVSYCCDCGKEITYRSKRCPECAKLASRISTRPDRNVLKTLVRTKSFAEIGREYNVSDNAIRKWCIAYNLPHTKKAISLYSDEEWNQL